MRTKSKAALGLLAPALIVLFIMTFVPMIYTAVISLFEYDLKAGPEPTAFLGFEQYISAFTNPTFWLRVWTTVSYTVISVSITIVLGIALAMLLQKTSRMHTIMKMVLIFPYAISPAVKGYLWRFMLQDGGMLDSALDFLFPFAEEFIWLADGNSALFFLATTEIWGWTPLVALMFVGALGQISPSIFEAAALDGVKNSQMFRYITFPLLRPVLASTTVLKTIFSLKMYDTVVTMTGGGPGEATQTINFYIYQSAFRFLNMGYASALAIIVVAIVLVLVWVYVRTKKREEAR